MGNVPPDSPDFYTTHVNTLLRLPDPAFSTVKAGRKLSPAEFLEILKDKI